MVCLLAANLGVEVAVILVLEPATNCLKFVRIALLTAAILTVVDEASSAAALEYMEDGDGAQSGEKGRAANMILDSPVKVS